MPTAQLIDIALALLLVLLNGFFVGAEFSLVQSRTTRLQEIADNGSFFARTALWEKTHIDVYLSATQVGVTLASLGLGWVGEPTFAHLIAPLFRRWGPWGSAVTDVLATLVAFALITYLHILFGELLPKTVAILKAERLAMAVAWPLHAFYLVFYPVIRVLNRSSNFILRAIGLRPASEHVTSHTEEEILMILSESARGGSLKDSEVLLVERSFEFADTPVHAVMVPRVDIDYLSLEWDTPTILSAIRAHPHSRYPVVEDDDLDRVRGFVYLKELIPQVAEGQIRINRLLRELHIVPESQSIERLLRELQTRHTKIALVLDEYGGTAGIVTMEDLVEELVGDLSDELDQEPPDIQRREGGFIIQGAAALSDVGRELDEELESEHYDTLGGWTMEKLERVPREGDSVESDRYVFRIARMEGPRVVEVEAQSKPAPPTDSGLNPMPSDIEG